MIKTISFIGSGNVATQFAKAFHAEDISIVQILSKTFDLANELAIQVSAKAIAAIDNLDLSVDLIIIAVNDDFIEEIANSLNSKGIVIHTSGTTDIDVLKICSNNIGVGWPIKSIKKEHSINFSNVSCCIESSNTETKKDLIDLFSKISNKVVHLNGKQREYLHMAAVITNNFSNYFYGIAEEITSENDIDFSILKGLINESTQQLDSFSPKEMQTGPAIRNDKKVIKKHLKLLENNPEYYNLYKFVSESIINKYHG